MLVVLAEINCLDTLRRYNVYPDLFYTDVNKFTNDSVMFRDASVMIILAGCCAFSKRRIYDMIKYLNRRAETEVDRGIKHVYVVSDCEMPYLGAYYKYTLNMDRCDVMRGSSCIMPNAYIWDKLSSEEKETVSHLSDYDAGDTRKFLQGLTKNANSSAEDNYRKYIKIPDLKKLLS